ncbi:CoA transferase subunit A [Corynebacterium aquatimens]|uniref:CoA transferase subunit A n=1 Tax=Corynebacterium aquatimens TaxID=1190508 RepID=UPI00253FEBCA|nr:CoA-transferase [Corynebacterium aquatimens]
MRSSPGPLEDCGESGVKDLCIVSNNLAIDGVGQGLLLENEQISKVKASYIGENQLFMRRYLAGEIDLEFVPQGTLAERMRAGGAGIAAFFTRTGVGTILAEGSRRRNSMGKPMLWRKLSRLI